MILVFQLFTLQSHSKLFESLKLYIVDTNIGWNDTILRYLFTSVVTYFSKMCYVGPLINHMADMAVRLFTS